MSVPNLGAMRAVAERLDRVGLPYAFVGGSVVNLLVDHPELIPARPTDDVDVIIDLISGARYSEVEAKGFLPPDEEGRIGLLRRKLEGLAGLPLPAH